MYIKTAPICCNRCHRVYFYSDIYISDAIIISKNCDGVQHQYISIIPQHLKFDNIF